MCPAFARSLADASSPFAVASQCPAPEEECHIKDPFAGLPPVRVAAASEVRVVDFCPGVEFHKQAGPDSEWRPVTKGLVLKSGDDISCDPDGRVILAFADNSTVVLAHTTQLNLASLFAEGGVVTTYIQLIFGQVAAKVNKSDATKSDFRIKSPTAIAGVRGTEFTTFYDPGTKAMTVSTKSGSVRVDPTRRGLPTRMVGPGKEVEVTPKSITKLAPIGKAGARGGTTRREASELVAKVLEGARACGLTTPRSGATSIRPAKRGWTATVKLVAGTRSAKAVFSVVRGKVTAKNALAKAVAKGCRA